MKIEQRIQKLLSASFDQIALIDNVLDGKANPTNTPGDRRLLTLMDAARELNVSRMTVHRMAADGRLPVVETRLGRRRIPSAALTALLQGKEAV